MKNLVIFPYNNESKALINHCDMIKGYEHLFITSFIEDKILLEKLNRDSLDKRIIYESNFDISIQKGDTILFCNNIKNFSLSIYQRKIQKAIAFKKNILMPESLYQDLISEFPEIARYPELTLLSNYQDIPFVHSHNIMYELSAPVVSVAGFGENCDKFDIQIMLMKDLKKSGYNVISFSSNDLGSLLGMYTYPKFLYKTEFNLEQKIILFNHYLYELSKYEDIDIFVMGYPGGIMPFNNKFHNHFMELSTIISCAAESDAGILSIYFDHYLDDGYLDELRQYTLIRLNMPIDYFCIARQKYVYDEEEKDIKFYFLDEDFLRKNMHHHSNFRNSLIDINNNELTTNAFKKIVKKFEANPELI